MHGIYSNRLSRTFDLLNYVFLILLAIITIYPFLHVVAVSLSSFKAYMLNPMMIFPKDITFDAYSKIFSYPTLGSSYKTTVLVTVIGTFINMLLTVTLAYPLSKRDLKGTSLILVLIIFSMIFKPALIPKYYVVRNLGLIDTIWALILPTAISPFNLILMKNFFSTIPKSLEESAFIDGASEYNILLNIIIPLSKHAIATISLFYAVFHWNNFFSAVVFIKSIDKWPLQLLLREVIMENNTDSIVGGMAMQNPDLDTVIPYTIQMATVVVAVLPILFVYPFLQKYFVKGVTLGAIKE